ncbi:MAG: aminotransferase class I/II-fold pyridoxal phosphate-dependent enzyme [Synergistaceae bacterium]|jgi:histidinol-phosphate aminotransferase|nr:aminotransferase class I/II-fold pyridoxal phosphate-dependent enzyme [Synergistaceae bacterium]
MGDETANNHYFRRLVRSEVLSLEEYSAGPASDSEGAVRISANENGFGPAPAVRDAVMSYINAGPGLYRYPNSSCGVLRDELSGKHGLPPEWFLVGNGLDDVISIIGMTFLDPGDEVLLPALSFVMYESAVRLPGANPVMIPMKPDMSIDVAAMASSVTSATKMIILCSPNNPTGTIVRTGEFVNLLDVLSSMPAQPLVVIDQAYAEFVDSGEDYPDVIGGIGDHNNIIVLRTFSKMSALAGLRIGYAIAHPTLLSYMYRVRHPYSVNTLAQVAALADIREESAAQHRLAAKRSIAASRERLEKFFEEEGVSFVRSYANFVFALYDLEVEDLANISAEMASEGIFARTLRYNDSDAQKAGMRLSIGTDEENERLIKTLRTILRRRREKISSARGRQDTTS